MEIVSYSLFAQLNIGGELIISISDTNKAKDQRRTVLMKLAIVKRMVHKRIEMTMVCFFPLRAVTVGL